MLGCGISPCGSLPITGTRHHHLRVLYIQSIFNQSIVPQIGEGQHSQEDKRQKLLNHNNFSLSTLLLLCETKYYEDLLISQDSNNKSPSD